VIQAYTFETMGRRPSPPTHDPDPHHPHIMRWRNEISVNGASSSLVEGYEYMFTDDERAST
jgi:hypothetical protein